MIYLDNAATTKVDKDVITDISWCLENVWGNPSSIHTHGMEAKKLLEQSREKVAKFIGAETNEIIFTSSGSESNNLAIKGFLDCNKLFNCIITTKIEHPSVYATCKSLEDNYIVEYAYVNNNGLVDLDKFRKLISLLSKRKFCFVSIMLANNEIGTIQPIKEIARIVHNYQGVLHVDATQAVGQIPVNVKELGCDLLTFSGHKLNCPKGIGVLYKKKGINLSPIICGGHQENGLRAGTENLAYIYSLGNQVERLKTVIPNYEIRDYLLCEIITELKDNKIKLRGTLNNRLPNNLSITFENVNAETLITLLDMKGVCVSAGSACSSGNSEPSRVLKVIGLSDEDAFNTIRISIGKDTTIEECDEFVSVLSECLISLRIME